MKQEIFTFPLWDAFQDNTECPLCRMLQAAEESYISGLFRDMVNDADFHNALRYAGFCSGHFQRLLNYRDKLGLALIVDKLLLHEISKLNKLKRRMETFYISPKSFVQNIMKKIFHRSTVNRCGMNRPPCCLCNHVNEMMYSYMGSIIRLWACNSEFQAVYENCKGFCFNHFYLLIMQAQQELAGTQLRKFYQTTFLLQENNIRRLNDELNWFIKKFNYYYANSPWNSSRDSLKRCIFKIAGSKGNM